MGIKRNSTKYRAPDTPLEPPTDEMVLIARLGIDEIKRKNALKNAAERNRAKGFKVRGRPDS